MDEVDGIARLVDPMPGATFMNQYWQEKPLVIHRHRSTYFSNLLSIEQIEALLANADLPSSGIDVANADEPVDRNQYVVGGTVDMLKVQQFFSKGGTIVLSEVQRYLPALALLCRYMEKEFSGPFQTNVYVTPPLGKGFRPHYDTHDVFVLQVSGSKHWTVCGNPVQLPLPSQPFDRVTHQSGDVQISCQLSPGDLLYIPRGFVHHARSLNEISLHITLGALVPTWAEVLTEMVGELALTEAAFRRALPADFATCRFDAASVQKAFEALLQRINDPVLLRTVLARLAENFVVGRRPLAPDQLQQLLKLPTLSLADQVGPRPGSIYRVRTNAESVVVLCHGREIVLPSDATEALRFALSRPRYAVSDIPGQLDGAGKLALVRRLIEEGLVMCYMLASH